MTKRWWLFLSLLIASIAPLQAETAGDELLDPEVAFAMQASAGAPDRIVVDWKIAEGYYLYRDKFAFASETDGITLGEPLIPRGKVKKDEFFGEVETFRKSVQVEIPITRAPNAPEVLALRTVSQGCADLGVCYPPLTQRAVLNLPKAAASAPAGAVTDALAALKGLSADLGGGEPELLDPDQAFQLSVEVRDANTLEASWRVAEGYYLYRDEFAFSLRDAPGMRLGEAQLPAGKMKDDEFFGRVEIFDHDVQALVPVTRDAGATSATLVVQYQGCAELGVCYPPITREVSLDFGGAGAARIGAAAPAAAAASAPASGSLSEQDRLARFLVEKPLWVSAGLFFLLGIGLAFTPCVFPMIPILSGIIIGQGKSITTRRAFSLSLIYVLAMALTYTVAGVIVALLGANVQAMFQDPWVLSAFAIVFVLLALSMFGFYELQMPSAIQSKLSDLSNRQGGGTWVGVAIMGFLSALIVGPCVTAPLVAALLVIGQTGDPVLGATALFSLSMGMGAPLLAIGTSAGKLLPRAGGWMDAVKAVFGVLLIAVAIWLLERIVPAAVSMALWAVLLIVSAIYLGALEPVREGASGWARLWKGTGLVLLLWGALLLVGAAAGGRDVLQPLKGVVSTGAAGGQAAPGALVFQKVKGPEGLAQALAQAGAQGRPVMLDFYADWCVSCKEMEKYTFSDAGVQAALSGVVLLKTDVTPNDAQDQALLKQFGLFGPPAILFFDPAGEEIKARRVVGFVPADEFAQHVRATLGR